MFLAVPHECLFQANTRMCSLKTNSLAAFWCDRSTERVFLFREHSGRDGHVSLEYPG